MIKRIAAVIVLSTFSVLVWGCGGTTTVTNTNTTTNTANTNANATAARETITIAERPQKVKDQMAARGEQDQAAPTLAIVEPKANATVNSSTVKVKLNISGDLKGYKPHKDPETGMGNHIHVILDNQPYEAYYNLDQEFELRNVTDGEHTIRVFPSRPWHESYKTAGAFQIVKFTVKGGSGDPSKPTTTSNGNTMANANSNAKAAPAAEGKDMPESKAGPVDPTKPLLTYSRPKGEYKGPDAEAIMIDFWLANAKLKGDGGTYRVRAVVSSPEGGENFWLDKWEPVWLKGLSAGKHTIVLELIDADGNVVDNGGYNSTSREITVVK